MKRTLPYAALLLALAASAQAQLLDSVKGQLGASTPNNPGGLATLSPGTTGNAAGVLDFCIKNNYLAGGDAGAIKDKLVGKLGGGAAKPEADPGYASGIQGILKGKDGKSMDLSGGGLKQELAQKACDQVLQYGKSLL
ncbi:DUF2501 domain-containing protein [Bordetella pseudohinzii]|uniref:Protein of uncharacterized function (DUF2501) n=1 Tax=Bordetella pseudohinzii TaxID=1331258 RepID=A0A0J6C1M1_9BORD|nr:DUF2501 domain-containing protein [Bordetella pseudohinzii]ANY16622.1 hypothetical protein BBN53_12410 [Bordetella pseudohinzii]KMM27784.1 hypothetical protein L540_01930 [Bordetella pseudohinzii]KXA81926.1 hypothetical protein AW877_03405 [Bordetella pseudohinzii]KXA82227.1 hypothetical protein AW878_03025 [Bordetella pseudohinzii]CUI30507.1 Protein of uncharacterised function (DUF2501) [Bordetella pseudohinzii]